jgi:glycosyltransferase involved in cell wall biosynthesis
MSSWREHSVSGAAVLYLSYDGMTDPLGRSQVLPYLAGLSARGHRISLISCEKSDRLRQHGLVVRQLCQDAGIAWHPLRYHKRPPILSSVFDVIAMRRAAERLHRQRHFDIVHCRSDMAALAGLPFKRRRGVRFIYDMRAFWPDERVEGGSWDRSNPVYAAVYRYFKVREAEFLSEADHVVSLTQEGRRVLLGRSDRRADGPPISVIPCCADFAHFPLTTDAVRAERRTELGIAHDTRLLAYLGSIGTWYMLDEMLDFFRVYRRRNPMAKMLFITPDAPATILTAARTRGVSSDELIIRPASREEVPKLLAAADVGLFFIKPVFSKKASSPTKLGEMFAVGLPIVTNAGVGDVEAIVSETEGGAIVREFNETDYELAIDALGKLETSSDEIRRRALHWFDVREGINRYDAIYRGLAGNGR